MRQKLAKGLRRDLGAIQAPPLVGSPVRCFRGPAHLNAQRCRGWPETPCRLTSRRSTRPSGARAPLPAMNFAPPVAAQQSWCGSSLARAQQASSSGGGASSSCRSGPPARCRSQPATGGSPARRANKHQRSVQCGVQAIAVPGPLFISEGFDRDRLRDSKTQQLQPSGTFLTFPLRPEAELTRTPPLVRWVLLPSVASGMRLVRCGKSTRWRGCGTQKAAGSTCSAVTAAMATQTG